MPMKFTCVLASLLSVSLACLQTYGIYNINNNNEHKTQITRDKKKNVNNLLCRLAHAMSHFLLLLLSLFLVVLR